MFLTLLLSAAATLQAQQPGSALDSLARVAIARNLAVRRAAESERQADAAVSQARGLFLPALGVEARYSRFDGVVNIGDFINPAYATLNELIGREAFPTNIDATLPFRQESKLRGTVPLFNGALFANLAAARSMRSLRGAERAAAVRRLDADVRIAWLDWARAARAVEILDAALPVIAENARAAQRLVDAGSATPDAVLRARADLAEARQLRGDAARLRDAARGALNLLLDRAPDAPVPAFGDDALPPLPVVTLADALAASRRREEFAMAGAAVDGARAQGPAATSAYLPSVSLAAEYGIQGNAYQFDRSHDVAMGTVVLSWNLFNGAQDAARRGAAAAAERGAELQRTEVERQVALDVRMAWDAVAVAREALAASTERLGAARAAFTLVDRRFTEGFAPHLEWSDARARLTAAELNVALSRYALAARVVNLERAAALRTVTFN